MTVLLQDFPKVVYTRYGKFMRERPSLVSTEIRLRTGRLKNHGKRCKIRVQTGPGAHPVYSSVGTAAQTPRIKRPRHEAGHSCPSGIEVKETWSYNCISTYIVIKHRDKFNFVSLLFIGPLACACVCTH
jgi:hypothetical protein